MAAITDIFLALDATWPPAEALEIGPFRVRRGEGGGSRVSAATAQGPWVDNDITKAAAQMRSWEQPSLFQIRDGSTESECLDRRLEEMGYTRRDPTRAMVVSVHQTKTLSIPELAAIPSDRALAIQNEIWDKAGVGAARRAIMTRAAGPKTWLLGRTDDRPAGVAFVAVRGTVAMLHALEVAPQSRRRGLGRAISIGAVAWAKSAGAAYFALLVTSENTVARNMYESIGFKDVGGYHYRVLCD